MATVENAAVQASAGFEQEAFAPRPTAAPRNWHPLTRVGFRICFIYFCGIIYLYGNDSNFFTNHLVFPKISIILNWPLNHLALFAGRYIFRIHGLPNNWQVTHRGDDLINWVLTKVFFGAAVIGGLTWTAVAHLRRSRRTQYETLLAWIRFFLRLTVAFFMIGYGMIKVFPLQMAGIPMITLTQPLGDLSPHRLLWSLVGLHPLYESICGAAEVLGGVLLLFRRTALAGAMFCVFVLSNIVLYNFFFDVLVKLFALNLLLAAIFLVVPDTKPLLDFFWYRKPAIPADNWAPKSSRWSVRAYVRMLEIVFIVASLILIPYGDAAIWSHYHQLANFQSPLRGVWKLDDPQTASGPFKTPKVTAVKFSIERADTGILLFPGGGLMRVSLEINGSAHTIRLNDSFTYRWEILDADHLVLTAVPPKLSASAGASAKSANPSSTLDVIMLTRVGPAAHYRLLEYPFQFVAYQ